MDLSLSLLQCADIIADGGTTDTRMHLDVHVIPQGQNDLLNLLGQLTGRSQDERLAVTLLRVNLGQGTNGKGSCFTLDR